MNHSQPWHIPTAERRRASPHSHFLALPAKPLSPLHLTSGPSQYTQGLCRPNRVSSSSSYFLERGWDLIILTRGYWSLLYIINLSLELFHNSLPTFLLFGSNVQRRDVPTEFTIDLFNKHYLRVASASTSRPSTQQRHCAMELCDDGSNSTSENCFVPDGECLFLWSRTTDILSRRRGQNGLSIPPHITQPPN